ncbi:MAG: TetR family transcriptional regulator [Nocardioides sp.]
MSTDAGPSSSGVHEEAPPEGLTPQEARRRRMMDTALALASAGGYEAVQMRTVAEQAEVALGTLYRYFPSKVHLLLAALAVEFEENVAMMRAFTVPGDTPAERLMAVVGYHTQVLAEEPNRTEALTRAFIFADASAQDSVDRVVDLLTAIFSHAIGANETPTEADGDLARVIGDVWLGALVGWVTGRVTPADVEQTVGRAVRLIFHTPDCDHTTA